MENSRFLTHEKCPQFSIFLKRGPVALAQSKANEECSKDNGERRADDA
jgi:hypothetical protein